MAAAAPSTPDIHLFESDDGFHLFVANGSRLFDVSADLFARLGAAVSADRVGELLAQIGADGTRLIDDAPLEAPPIHALSLAVAQKCNLGCTYCYAQQGAFGGEAKNMPLATANEAVDLLLAQAGEGGKATLAFLGGEPLVNRSVVQAVTQRAAELARRRGITLSFSTARCSTKRTRRSSKPMALPSPSASMVRARPTTACGHTRAAPAASTALCATCSRCWRANAACRCRRG
jgi:uncharacterized protein